MIFDAQLDDAAGRYDCADIRLTLNGGGRANSRQKMSDAGKPGQALLDSQRSANIQELLFHFWIVLSIGLPRTVHHLLVILANLLI